MLGDCNYINVVGGFPVETFVSLHLFNTKTSLRRVPQKVYTFNYILKDLEPNHNNLNFAIQSSVCDIRQFNFPPSYVVGYYSDSMDFPADALVQIKIINGNFHHELGVSLLSFNQYFNNGNFVSTFKLRVGNRYITLEFSMC